MYDPVTDIWTDKPAPPLEFAERASSVVDNKILYAGNIIKGNIITNSGDEDGVPRAAGWTGSMKITIYDPVTNEWICEKAETTITSGNGDAGTTTGIYAPQRVYILGALTNNNVYDLATDTWTRGTPMPSSRQNFGIAVVDDILYVIGGSPLGGTPLDINEQYIPLDYYRSTSTPLETSETTDTPNTHDPYRNNSLLITTAVAVIVIAIVLITTGLFFYFRKKVP
jgi:hypothetical protein